MSLSEFKPLISKLNKCLVKRDQLHKELWELWEERDRIRMKYDNDFQIDYADPNRDDINFDYDSYEEEQNDILGSYDDTDDEGHIQYGVPDDVRSYNNCKKHLKYYQDCVDFLLNLKRNNRKRTFNGIFRKAFVDWVDEDWNTELEKYKKILKIFKRRNPLVDEQQQIEKDIPELDKKIEKMNEKFVENLLNRLKKGNIPNYDKVSDLKIEYGRLVNDSTSLDSYNITYTYTYPDGVEIKVGRWRTISVGLICAQFPFMFAHGGDKKDGKHEHMVLINRISSLFKMETWFRVE